MLTKVKLALVLCGLVAGGAGLAAAGGFGGGAGSFKGKAAMMAKYDKNGDGVLDASEKAAMKADFQAKRAERKAEMLAKYDTNKDGKLDQSERAVMKNDRAEAAFKKLDTNGDGQISLDEFKAGKAFARGGFHHRGMRHRGLGKGQP